MVSLLVSYSMAFPLPLPLPSPPKIHSTFVISLLQDLRTVIYFKDLFFIYPYQTEGVLQNFLSRCMYKWTQFSRSFSSMVQSLTRWEETLPSSYPGQLSGNFITKIRFNKLLNIFSKIFKNWFKDQIQHLRAAFL